MPPCPCRFFSFSRKRRHGGSEQRRLGVAGQSQIVLGPVLHQAEQILAKAHH